MNYSMIKTTCDLLAAVAGATKEGFGLAEKLSSNKAEIKGLLPNLLVESGYSRVSNEVQTGERICETIRISLPIARRIAKKKIILRIRGAVLVVLAIVITRSLLLKAAVSLNQAVFHIDGNSLYVSAALTIFAYLAGVWIARIVELKTSEVLHGELNAPVNILYSFARIVIEKSYEANAAIGKLLEWQVDDVSALESDFLRTFGEMQSRMEILELSLLIGSCSRASIASDSAFEKELSECILRILKGALPELQGYIVDDWLMDALRAHKIEFLLGTQKYGPKLHSAARMFAESPEDQREGLFRKAFFEETPSKTTPLFPQSSVVSARMGIRDYYKIWNGKIRKNWKPCKPPDDDETE
jgi:hypothetical protein